jgi:hypothetical protein
LHRNEDGLRYGNIDGIRYGGIDGIRYGDVDGIPHGDSDIDSDRYIIKQQHLHQHQH